MKVLNDHRRAGRRLIRAALPATIANTVAGVTASQASLYQQPACTGQPADPVPSLYFENPVQRIAPERIFRIFYATVRETVAGSTGHYA